VSWWFSWRNCSKTGTGKDDDLNFGSTVSVFKPNVYGVDRADLLRRAQIMCWTFIIQYAEVESTRRDGAEFLNIMAMVIFLAARSICTFFLKYISQASCCCCSVLVHRIPPSVRFMQAALTGLTAGVLVSASYTADVPLTSTAILRSMVGEGRAKLGSAGLRHIVGGVS
jgi:FHS family L-fucose permease-like MFS transporter